MILSLDCRTSREIKKIKLDPLSKWPSSFANFKTSLRKSSSKVIGIPFVTPKSESNLKGSLTTIIPQFGEIGGRFAKNWLINFRLEQIFKFIRSTIFFGVFMSRVSSDKSSRQSTLPATRSPEYCGGTVIQILASVLRQGRKSRWD